MIQEAAALSEEDEGLADSLPLDFSEALAEDPRAESDDLAAESLPADFVSVDSADLEDCELGRLSVL